MLRPSFRLGPVSFATSPGLHAVVGDSGSGKTTLLSLLAGLRPPSSGRVLFAGADLAALADADRARLRRRTVAYAAQAPVFLESSSVRENLLLAARLRGSVDDGLALLASVDLAPFAERNPASLSGGELARVNACRAFVGDPPVVCLDEPTAMLDEANAERVRELVRRESERRCVVVATHDERLLERARLVLRLVGGLPA